MIDPIDVMIKLDAQASELDRLSKDLADVERRLEPVTMAYEDFIGSFEEGLWNRHVDQGDKLPSEALRLRMAHRAMPTDLLGRYSSLIASRKRMEKRIGSLKSEISARQSILSALREEMAASGSGIRKVA